MLYTYLDESGNFDFTPNGTEYFILSAVSAVRPFPPLSALIDLKYDLWEDGVELEYFHASEDKQYIRDQVFRIIANCIDDLTLDAIIVKKRKTHPALQNDPKRFYKRIFEILIKYVLEGQRNTYNKIMIICDTVPLKRKRKDLEKAMKTALARWAKQHNNSYHIQYCASKSDFNLQVADYLCWAVFRKWELQDLRSYNLIQTCIHSEFDVFETGTNYYY